MIRGMAAFGMMAVATLPGSNEGDSNHWRRAIGASLGILAAVCLATAGAIAALYWRPLLIEQASNVNLRTDLLADRLTRIAFGLPVVTITGGLGALACLVFVAAVLSGRGSLTRSPDEIPRSSE